MFNYVFEQTVPPWLDEHNFCLKFNWLCWRARQIVQYCYNIDYNLQKPSKQGPFWYIYVCCHSWLIMRYKFASKFKESVLQQKKLILHITLSLTDVSSSSESCACFLGLNFPEHNIKITIVKTRLPSGSWKDCSHYVLRFS